MTENSFSLTGCNRLTCKGDGKLFQHVYQVNPTSSDDDDRIFRNQRNFPTVNLTSFDDSDGIFRNQRNFPTFSVLTRRSFPTVFRQFSDNFPTIFCQLSDKKSKSAAAAAVRAGREPTSTRVTICYSTTAPHLLYVFVTLSALSYPLSV